LYLAETNIIILQVHWPLKTMHQILICSPFEKSGKSELAKCLKNNLLYVKDRYTPTIGFDLYDCGGKVLLIEVGSRYKDEYILSLYTNHAEKIFICIDASKPYDKEAILAYIRYLNVDQTKIKLIATKLDLATSEMQQQLQQECHPIPILMTSVVSGEGIDEIKSLMTPKVKPFISTINNDSNQHVDPLFEVLANAPQKSDKHHIIENIIKSCFITGVASYLTYTICNAFAFNIVLALGIANPLVGLIVILAVTALIAGIYTKWSLSKNKEDLEQLDNINDSRMNQYS